MAFPPACSELRLQEGPPPQLPFEQLLVTLAYAQQQLQANLQIQQTNREVLALELRLPIDLAFTALPWPQRLLDNPLALSVHIQQPPLAAFHRWQPNLPPLTGTLQGTIDVQGTYATLALDADMQLHELGVGDLATQIEAPVHLTAEMVTAESVQALAQALQQGHITPTLQEAVLRVPTLEGQLSDQAAAPQPFHVRDLLLRANGQWRPEGLQATLQTLELQAQAFEMPPAELSMAAQLTPQLLELTSLQVRLAQSEVHGQGQLALPSQELQFRVEIPRLQLDILPLELPPELPPMVQGVVIVDGTIQAPQVDARLRYAEAQIHAALAVQLQEPLPSYNATVRVEGLDMATLLAEGQGQLNAGLQLQGMGFTTEQRRADLDLTLDTSGFTLAPGLTARLQASLAGDAVRLEDFHLRSVPVDVVASGTLSAAQRAMLTYTVTLGDLTALESLLGAALQASGTLSGTVEGPLDALQTQGRLQMTDWRVAALTGQRLQAEFSAEQLPAAPQATLRAQLVGVQGPSLPASGVQLAANYSSPQGDFTLTVTQGPYENTMLAGSALLADGQQLTLRRLHLQRGDLVWQNERPIEVMRSPQGMIELQQMVLRSGTQEVSARGRLDPAGPVQGKVRVSQLQIQPTVQAVAPDTPAPEGRLNLDLTLDGTLNQPRALGSVEVSALAWQEQALGDIRAELDFRNQILRTDLRWRFQEQEILQVRGTVGLSTDDRLALQAQAAAIDLALLEPLSPTITHSSGTLRLDLDVRGRLQQPQVYGSLQVSEGALQLAPTGERYRDLEARLSFAGDRIDIERLHVGSRSGPLQLTGRIEHSGLALERVNLVMRAEEFTAMYTPAIQTVISGEIAVLGSLQEMLATGSVTVPRGRVILDEIPWGGPREVQPWELTVPGVYGPGPEAVAVADDKAAATALGPGFSLPFLRTDLTITLPQNFWVQAPRTAVELSGELRVAKERNQSFALNGAINTVRGYATYYGKKFELEEGHVIFTGSEDINPHLDITVTHAVAGYVISIHVGGTIREPAISFSSTPELSETDIISLLVIGKTSDRLTSSEQGALTNQLQQLAGGLAAARLEQAIGEQLGIDIIEITPGETLGTGTIGAGRYITQKLFVSIGQQFAGAGFRISIEYSITPRLKLELSSSDAEGTAVDILWRRDY